MKRATILACLMSLSVSANTRADVKPAAIFSDHMVLQADVEAPVWGWAEPGEKVTVTLDSKPGWTNYPPLLNLPLTKSTTAGPDGKWMVKLDSMRAGPSVEMTIAGKNSIKITDILFGEVWLGSGQSNMEFTVSKDLTKYPTMAKRFSGVINEEQEIAAANYPMIRMFTVKMKTSETPLDDVEGQWQVCSPETVPGFSAVGYFFSRDLQKAINRPIGFINSSYGASCAQAWVSKDVLDADPRLKANMDRFAGQVATFRAAAANPPATAPTTQARGGRGGRGGAPRSPFSDQHSPFVLYNAMLKPVQPYAIKGVLWYQGESITEGINLYPVVMEHVITSWRKQFAQDFPFYLVQLAALDNNSNRPEVREAQAQALKVPNTAMTVTIDIGDKSDVHPHNKQDLGAPPGAIARARDYGEKIEWSGPVYDSMKIDGNSIRIKFTHAGGLMAKDGSLKTVQIAGEDKKFVDATAKIEGDSIVVSSPDISSPKAVRYAWNRWPEGANLYNGDNLPAAPFRTDAW